MTGLAFGVLPLENPDAVPSPALLVHPDRVAANIRTMVAMAGGPSRLRPHVKTHKLPEVVRLQQAQGIDRFKCATIAEAEMVARCGAADVLLAYQPVGPNIRRLIALTQLFPETRFSTLVDNAETVRSLGAAARDGSVNLDLLVDIDCGMGRTGIAAGPQALSLYRLIAATAGVRLGGFHVYDGHIHQQDPAERAAAAAAAFAPFRALRAGARQEGLAVPRTVAGGTPTFAYHASDPDNECSPGTCLLWDASYRENLPEMDFQNAAFVLTRVVSRPAENRVCLDLGYKAIASENPPPRVRFLNLPDAHPVLHNEEHLVLETPRAAELPVGTVIYGIPWHVCPTVALHSRVFVVEGRRVTGTWSVAGRDRMLTV